MGDLATLADELERLVSKASDGGQWRAQVWEHSGATDTVCIKAGEREIVHWAGFDGVPCTKAEIKANARLIAKLAKNLPAIIAALRSDAALRTELARAREGLEVIGDPKGRFSRGSGVYQEPEHALRSIKAFARAILANQHRNPA